jgi:myosin protein heavy chain
LEKSKQTLEAENADLAADLKASASSKSELERKRKIVESQLSKYLVKLNSMCNVIITNIFSL